MTASKAKTEDKSARSRRTEDKSAAHTTAARDEGRPEQNRNLGTDPGTRDNEKLAKLGESEKATGPLDSAKEAAKLAQAEAEAAGVSGQAVMRSGQDGYGSGTGEVVEVNTASDEDERNVGSVPSRIVTAAEPKKSSSKDE